MIRRRTFLKQLGAVASLGFLSSSSTWPQKVGSDIDPVNSGPIANGHRHVYDDRYEMAYEWYTHDGQQWSVDYTIDGAAYNPGSGTFRGYRHAFHQARSNPAALTLSNRLGLSLLDREKAVDVAVRFAQSFDYASDIDSKGVHEYNRSIEEHLVEGIGDCKDGTYLLAGILSQPPFEFRTAVVIMPTHMLLGVHSADLPGQYSDAELLPGGRYVPIETTVAQPPGYRPDGPIFLVYDGELRYSNPASIDDVVTGQVEAFSQHYLS